MAVSPKTIYLETDEEITSVIDKIRKTEFTDVVLVIPKGASITQSVVNLKLIKRKAEELNKHVSIVTGDKVARNLAEKVGIVSAAAIGGLGAASAAVADAGLVMKPETDAPLEETNEVIFDSKPAEAEPAELSIKEGEEVVAEDEGVEDALVQEAKPDKKKKDNLMPKFPWLKVALFAGIPILLLLAAAYFYLPRAKANVYVKSEKKSVSINVTGESNATLDADKAVIPTQTVEATGEASKKYPATGKKDAGTKATGTVFVSATTNISWVAGTRLSLGSDSSIIYRTDGPVNVAAFSSKNGINVTADAPGEKYNIPSGKTLNAINDPSADITSSSAFTGGTTKEVTVVSDGDVAAAKDSATKDATDQAMADFTKKSSDLKIIDETKKTEAVSSSASPSSGQEASDFTMNVKVSVKALAVNLNDLSAIIKAEVNRTLGSTMTVIDDGSKTVDFKVGEAALDTGKISGTITTDAFVASKQDTDKIKTELEGLNDTQAVNYLKGLDGVVDAKNDYWPPFIQSFPRIKNNITVTVLVAPNSGN